MDYYFDVPQGWSEAEVSGDWTNWRQAFEARGSEVFEREIIHSLASSSTESFSSEFVGTTVSCFVGEFLISWLRAVLFAIMMIQVVSGERNF